MKLITACLLGLLSANVYALDCWGYMNKPKAIREACMVEANSKLNQPQSVEQRDRVMSDTEEGAIRKVLVKKEEHLIFTMALETAMRLSEMFTLKKGRHRLRKVDYLP